MNARAALERTAKRLGAARVDTPDVDAALLVAHILGVSRTAVSLVDAPLTAEQERELARLVARRERREPLAYVLGEWGFRRLTLRVDGRALVPRPETEIVVERALALLHGRDHPRVLDVGAGSGAIALAIADEHPGARVTGVDSSPAAIALARENARALGLDVELRVGDFPAAAEGWDLVVSNPPYVAAADWDGLQPEIRDWEPRSALVDQAAHRRIAELARTEWLVLEVGDGQAAGVAAEVASLGYRDVAVSPDLTGRERVVEARSVSRYRSTCRPVIAYGTRAKPAFLNVGTASGA